MARWEISLDGFDRVELNRWLSLFDSSACKVTKKEGGGYCLTACRFEKLDDKEVVLKSTGRLTTMMKAIDKIENNVDSPWLKSNGDALSCIRERVGDKYTDYTYACGSLISIREQIGDTTNVTVFPKPATAHSFALQPTVESRDVHGNLVIQEFQKPQPRQERWYDYYLNRCDDWIDSTKMSKALSYFAKKTTPRRLRLIRDIIMDDDWEKKASLKNNDWVKGNKLKDLSHFLNFYDLGGEELHVKKRPKKKHVKGTSANRRENQKPKMGLNQAQILIAQGLLKPWLIKKQEIYRKLALGEAQARYLFNKLSI